MADRRMISKGLSISKKFNINVSSNFTRMLYMMLIPHTDDFGRTDGCPIKVKALVIPMLDETWRTVEEALTEMHNAGLIDWYEVDGEKYLQIIDFDKHQSGLHKRTKSKFPDNPNNSGKFREVPGSSVNPPESVGKSEKAPEIPPELKRTELKGTEKNRTEQVVIVNEADADFFEPEPLPEGTSQPADAVKFYMDNYDWNISHYLKQDIEQWAAVMSEAVVVRALQIGLENGKDNWKYVTGVLENWDKQGVKNIEQAERAQAEFKAAQQQAAAGKGGGKRSGQGYSGKPAIEMVQGKADEDGTLSPEMLEKAKRLARKLDGKPIDEDERR